MPLNLRGRSVLTLEDFSPEEIRYLLRVATELKSARVAGTERQRLRGRNIALIFEKDSTRTRTGFEVAAHDQGAHVTYLGPSGTQIGHKESIKDTARVLGRIYDAIEFRGYSQSAVETLSAFAGVPVYNGLTDQSHPTQTLADLMTMREFTHKHLSDMTVAFLGDGRNNVARSLAIGAVKVGIDMRIAAPRVLWPDADFVARLQDIGGRTGGTFTLTESVDEAVRGADYLYTDVWLSMGEDEAAWEQRIETLSPYRIDAAVMSKTGNPFTKFMHCLPALHDTTTDVGADIHRRFGLNCMEVTDEVFESFASVVFDQSENRMHTIKAVLVATVAG